MRFPYGLVFVTWLVSTLGPNLRSSGRQMPNSWHFANARVFCNSEVSNQWPVTSRGFLPLLLQYHRRLFPASPSPPKPWHAWRKNVQYKTLEGHWGHWTRGLAFPNLECKDRSEHYLSSRLSLRSLLVGVRNAQPLQEDLSEDFL